MRTINRSPSYLVQNPYSYCFRMRVPRDLQDIVGKKELRYSLKTGYIGIAKNKARFLAGQVQLIFRLLRKGGSVLSELTEGRIRALVVRYIKDSIKELDERVYEEGESDPRAPFCDARAFHSYVNSPGDIREDCIVAMNLGDFSFIEGSVAELLEKEGIEEPRKQPQLY